MTPEHTGPYRVTVAERDRRARDGLIAGDCLNVCAACGARLVVPPSAGHGGLITHEADCERSWGFTVDEAIRYEDGSLATVNDWPSGIPHMRIVSQRVFATLDEAQRRCRAILAEHNVWSTAQVDALPASGGTIELPDGTTITVEPTAWGALAELVDHYAECGCAGARGTRADGYSVIPDDDRGIRHEDWVSCRPALLAAVNAYYEEQGG